MVPSFSRLVLIRLISVIALTDKREHDSEISVFYESPSKGICQKHGSWWLHLFTTENNSDPVRCHH